MRLLDPLNLAGYAVIGLIGFNQLISGQSERYGPAIIAGCLVTLGVFVLAFAARELAEQSRKPMFYGRLVLGIQIACAIANLTLVFDGTNTILLVLIAAQLPSFVSLRITIVVMAGLNVIAFFLLRDVHAQVRPLFNILAFATFEVFALVTALLALRLERANRDLTAVNAHLLATRSLLEEGARDGERLRLSRELHDVAGHSLTALKLHLELACRLPDDDRLARIRAAQTLADGLLDDIRGVVSQLRRHDGVDLPKALAVLGAGFPGIDVRLHVVDTLRATNVDQAEAILRAAQEALTNAIRHGNARSIEIDIRRSGTGLHAKITDDGRGARDPAFGNGLNGMRERLARLGGDMHVETSPGNGWVLSFSVPDASASPS
jgi:signal transduction histidine kinase